MAGFGSSNDSRPFHYSSLREHITREAKKQGLTLSKPESVTDADKEALKKQADGQKELLGATPKPPTVRDGYMLATYVKPHYLPVDKDKRRVGLEFSFELTDDHNGLLPNGVARAWRFMKKNVKNGKDGYGRIDVRSVPLQTVDVRLAPDLDDSKFHATAAISDARVKAVEEKGKGQKKYVFLFSFRVVVEVSKQVCGFADFHYGSTLWISMGAAQGELEEDDDQD